MSDPNWGFIAGDHWVICDVCGFRVRSSATRMRWDRMRVCRQDWETRHPQEKVKAKADRQRVPNARPDSEPQFLDADVDRDDL